MSKRFLAGMMTALAVGLACASGAAASPVVVVDFDDEVFASPLDSALNTYPNTYVSHGLRFDGFQLFTHPKENVGALPFAYTSTTLDAAIEPVVISRVDGGLFDLLRLDLALGLFNTGSLDSVTITGAGACAPLCTTTVDVNDRGFTRFDLTGFTNLSSVTVGVPQFQGQADGGYLSFDNTKFAVPEPGVWMMLLGGLLGSGYMLRRARQLAAVEA